MKSILTTVLVFAICITAFSQSLSQLGSTSKVASRLVITDAKINGEDKTSNYTSNNAYLVLYENHGSDEILFASVFPKVGSQSHGPISNYTTSKRHGTTDSYTADIYAFYWKYQNTYDQGSGDATVNIAIIHKPNNYEFVCTVKTDKGINAYKGYVANGGK